MKNLPANFIELLSLLGISADELTRVTAPTEYANVILPDKCFFVADGIKRFTAEYKNLIKEIADKIPAAKDKKYEKIYFTRTRFAKNDVGEKKIEKYFKKHGYTVISPEKYTFKEQLPMLKRCNYLAATDGSVLHNSIFMNAGSKVILLNRANYFADYSFALNQVNNVAVTYISSNLSILVPDGEKHIGPNFYYVSDNLLKYFGEESLLDSGRYWIDNFKDFKNYLKKYFTLDRLSERISQPYYYEKLQACLRRYYVMRKKVFPYCLLRAKYIPRKLTARLRKKKNGDI